MTAVLQVDIPCSAALLRRAPISCLVRQHPTWTPPTRSHARSPAHQLTHHLTCTSQMQALRPELERQLPTSLLRGVRGLALLSVPLVPHHPPPSHTQLCSSKHTATFACIVGPTPTLETHFINHNLSVRAPHLLSNSPSFTTQALRPELERQLPTSLLRGVRGLALLSVVRVGAGWSCTAGTGLVVARQRNGTW